MITLANQKQIFHSIDKLPVFMKMLNDMVIDTRDQVARFAEGKQQPYVLDDAIYDRSIALLEERLDLIACSDRQFAWWQAGKMNNTQRMEVERLTRQVNTIREETREVLDLVREMRHGSIDRILEKSDIEVGLDYLVGDIQFPDAGGLGK